MMIFNNDEDLTLENPSVLEVPLNWIFNIFLKFVLKLHLSAMDFFKRRLLLRMGLALDYQ